MEMILSSLPPYLPSTLWCQGKIEAGKLKTRDYTRTLIASNAPEGMTLTVPVAGGSSATKRLTPDALCISGHGDWPKIHLGAIEAAYGREPYFQHLFPEIATTIIDYPEHLSQLNVLLMKSMLDFINYSEEIHHIKHLQSSMPERCSQIAKRLEAKINSGHSILEPLFRFGPETIFLL